MSTPICTGPECARPIHNQTRQLCKAHSKQWHTNGALKPLAAPRGAYAIPRVCSVDGCDRDTVAKGMCNRHYMAAKKRPSTVTAPADTPACAGPDCDRVPKAGGLCPAHYQQQRRVGTLTPIGSLQAAYEEPCEFPGCDRQRGARQWCKSHRAQERSGRPMQPIGQYHRDLTAQAEERRKAGHKPPSRRTKVKPKMPDGWNRKTKPVKESAVTDPTAAMTDVSFLVTPLPDGIRDKARHNMLAWGAGDLLEMLGLVP